MTHMQAPLWSTIGTSGVEKVRVTSMSSLVCRKFLETREPGCQEAECGPGVLEIAGAGRWWDSGF